MSDIDAVRRYLTPWRTRDGQVRYYVNNWMERIMVQLTGYLVSHDEAPTIPELERAKVWYDGDAVPHVDYVQDPSTRTFIENEMSKLFSDDQMLPAFIFGTDEHDFSETKTKSSSFTPSNEDARSNIESIRRYLKRYVAPDGSGRYYINNWQSKSMPAVERYLAEDADDLTRRQFWDSKAYFDDYANLHIVGIQDEILVEIATRYITHNYYLWGKDDATNEVLFPLEIDDMVEFWHQ